MSNPTKSPEFPPGLRLRNPQTGASFEVIEHTHAVRLRNLRTDAVSAIPQEMAREFEQLPAELNGDPTEPPRAELPSERAALSVRPCARNIHAALKRANLTVKGVRVTTGRRRCRVDLTATLEEYGPERAQAAEDALRKLWNDHRTRVYVFSGKHHWTVFILVDGYLKTVPRDVVELCHAAAIRENEGRTSVPLVKRAGAMASTPEHRDAVRARFHAREAERFKEALREGMVAVVRTAEALSPMLLQFARDASRASAQLAEVFGVPHPNACGLCGYGEGERNHPGSHVYRPPHDQVRLRRMQIRRAVAAPARARVHDAHVRYRRAVNLERLYVRLEREAPHWTAPPTELERAGLTEVPFDQQPDPRAWALPS